MPNNICIIPARGGSKRIPRKNIKNFLGKPIIAYSIEAALKSGLFQEVMVSTDDQEIAEIAKQYGAQVPFLRSVDNSNDFATTIDVLKEVFEKYKENEQDFDYGCCIYPTAPFVTYTLLCQAYDQLIEKNWDSILPIMKYSFPIQRSFTKNEKGIIHYQFEEYKNTRSQDLADSFHDAGQFYWFKKELLAEDSLVTSNSGSIEISDLQGQDIDNENDWKLAELKYEIIQSIK
ncbi:pseudaminic acid cytidylyltransferase [Sphingobacterium faecium]|uniref:pseudaminic acid cytidylyltransferase n=1 Tax=Sphingobacterium faecium TaxID=34087 RepID=UPI0032091AC8